MEQRTRLGVSTVYRSNSEAPQLLTAGELNLLQYFIYVLLWLTWIETSK